MLISKDCEYHLRTVFLQGKPGALGKVTPTQKQPSDQKSPQTRPKSVSRRGSGEGDAFDWPRGTKDDPATTCYELGITHPELNDGDRVDVPADFFPDTKHIRVITYFSSRLLLPGP